MQPTVQEMYEKLLNYLKEAKITIRENPFIKVLNHVNGRSNLEDRVSSLIRNNNTEDLIKHLLKGSSEEDVLSVLKVLLMYKHLGRKRYNIFIQQILLADYIGGADYVKTLSRVFDTCGAYDKSSRHEMHFGVVFIQNLAVAALHEGEEAAYSFIRDYEEKFKVGDFN